MYITFPGLISVITASLFLLTPLPFLPPPIPGFWQPPIFTIFETLVSYHSMSLL